MLSRAQRPLLSVAGSSKSLAPSLASCLAVQTRLSSDDRHKQAFKNPTGKKRKEKPRREKVAGSYLPLPTNQLAKLPLEEGSGSDLSEIPSFKKGMFSSSMVGKAVQFPALQGNMLQTFGLPRSMLVDFRLLSVPCSVQRKSTVALARRMDLAGKGSSLNDRLVLTGPSGCGKSYLLLQAVTYCAVNDWIVLYIPRARNLIDSSTSYFYDPRTQTYLQPTYSNQILQRLLTVNKKALETIKLTDEVAFEKRNPVRAGASLAELIGVAAAEIHLAPMILSIVLEQLGKQEQFPVLLAVDEFQALYCKTEYRNQHYEHIKSYHLSLPRLIMEYASGKKSFNRGAILGAMTMSLPHYPVPPELHHTLTPEQRPDPYAKLIPGMLEYAQGLKAIRVPEKLEYKEAAAMFEIWMKDKALHTDPSDELFLSKYSEAAGNARDFVHNGLLATHMS